MIAISFVIIVFAGYFTVRNVVFGADSSDEVVIGEPEEIGDIVLTSQDSTEILASRPIPTVTPIPSEADPAATPEPTPISLPEMPSCVGGNQNKGEKDNPYMVLEIVPTEDMQTLSWFSAKSPLTEFEISHCMAEKYKKSIRDIYYNPDSEDKIMLEYTYEMWDVEQEMFVSKRMFQEPKVLYTVIAQKMGGTEFSGIPEEIINDKYNWVTTDLGEQIETKNCTGYFIKTSEGPAYEKYRIDNYADKRTSTTQNQSENGYVWKFVTELPENATPIDQDFLNRAKNDQNLFINSSSSLTDGTYFEIEEWPLVIKTRNYKYEYYNIVKEDILKNTLLNPYKDVENKITYDKEYLKEYYARMNFEVVTVTAEQLNEMAKYDMDDTLDYIERADLIYLNGLSGNVDTQNFTLVNFYRRYVEEYDTYLKTGTYNKLTSENLPTFRNSGDIEWKVCMKIIKKLSTYRNVPFLIHSTVLKEDVDENVHNCLFIGDNNTRICRDYGATLTNATKLAQIAASFNLLARKQDPPSDLTDQEKKDYQNSFSQYTDFYDTKGCYKGQRTFMEDIWKEIKQIKLKEPNGNCYYTGYYNRSGLEGNLDQSTTEKSNYLWNCYTFYPTPEDTGIGNGRSSSDLSKKWGYLETFAFEDAEGTPVSEPNSGNRDKFRGTDGLQYKLHFQNVVGSPDNNQLAVPGTFKQVMEVMRNIMAKTPDKVSQLKVTVDKAKTIQNTTNVNFVECYKKYLSLKKDINYSDTLTVTIYFNVENSNDAPAVFSVHRVKEIDKDKEYFYKYNETKADGNDKYVQKSACLLQEVEMKNSNGEWVPVSYVIFDEEATELDKIWKAAESIDSDDIMIEGNTTKKFRFKYRISHDWQGKNEDNVEYPMIVFAGKTLGYSGLSSKGVNEAISSLPVKTKTSYTSLIFEELPLFNLE